MSAVGSAPSATLHRLERDVRLVEVTAVGSLPICVTLDIYAVNQLTFLRTQIFRRTVARDEYDCRRHEESTRHTRQGT